jgi:uncharacterized protein YciI
MRAATVPRTLITLFLAAAAPGATAQAQPDAPAAPPAAQAPRQLFLFLYRPGPGWVAGRPMAEQNLRPHGAYMAGLLRDGRLFAGGGYADGDGGLAVVRAADLTEARAMLAADPAIRSGVFVADLRPWRPRFFNDRPLVEAAR